MDFFSFRLETKRRGTRKARSIMCKVAAAAAAAERKGGETITPRAGIAGIAGIAGSVLGEGGMWTVETGEGREKGWVGSRESMQLTLET